MKMSLSRYFPTFLRAIHGSWVLSPWKSTPPWPADTLASQQKSLLRILGVAAEGRLEAAPIVAALAAEHRGTYRRRLRRLARRMAEGMSLSDALEQTPGALSDEHALAIRFGEQSGTLPTTIAGLANHPSPAEVRVLSRLRQIGFYVLITGSAFVLIMSFLMIKITPSFQAIFDDFQMKLPEITILMIRISQVFVDYWLLLAIPAIILAWLIRSQGSRRFFRRNISSRILRPIAQLRVANILELLAGNARAGRPLAGALSTLARYHFDAKLRHKLLFVRNEMEQGFDPWESMARAKLVSAAEADALAKAASAETRAWTMDRLADKNRGQVERRIDFYITLMQPAITLLIAGVVLFVAVACLTPLFNLISALT